MRSKEEIIKTIHVDPANFEFIAKNGLINGTLFIEIKRAMDEYASEVLRDKEKDEIKFNQCLREEFLLNAQLYPHEYHDLFIKKYQRAQKRFGEYLKTK